MSVVTCCPPPADPGSCLCFICLFLSFFPPPLRTFSPRCRYRFTDTETDVPAIWQHLQSRKRRVSLSSKYKGARARTQSRRKKKKSTRKQLWINRIVFQSSSFKHGNILIPRVHVIKSSKLFVLFCFYLFALNVWDTTTDEGSPFKHCGNYFHLWCYTRGSFAYKFITYIFIYCIPRYIYTHIEGHRNSIEHVISKQDRKKKAGWYNSRLSNVTGMLTHSFGYLI